jgi:hypothetical protein
MGMRAVYDKGGVTLVNAIHITASVLINADAHLKRQVMGRDAQRWLLWPTAGLILALGSGSFKARRNGWPVSLDGRRRKRELVKIIGE